MLFEQIVIILRPREHHTTFICFGKHTSWSDVSDRGEVPGCSNTEETIIYFCYIFALYLQVFQSKQGGSSKMLSREQTEWAFQEVSNKRRLIFSCQKCK